MISTSLNTGRTIYSRAFIVRQFYKIGMFGTSRPLFSPNKSNASGPRRSQPCIDVRVFGTSGDPYVTELIDNITHDEASGLFYSDIDGYRAFLKYVRDGRLMRILETVVPAELEGRGLAKILAKAALEFVANNDLKLDIKCKFVKNYVQKFEPMYKQYLA